jgi:lipopolysaccharide/colanic/teichoic acid biosynthesis glycosyltransferase
LEVRGIVVDRIAVMQPLAQLSRPASEAIFTVERASGVKIDWLVERLAFTEDANKIKPSVDSSIQASHSGRAGLGTKVETLSLGRYGYVKRAFDIVTAAMFIIALAPLACLVALLVALDVGLPIVFWQQRPGRAGRPFKLFKFCTMRAAHDVEGNRVPDELRSTSVGRWLRRTRLDELPQLYNILIGEMSFVGPRPLLPMDQPKDMMSRLCVRPGLTGWAQIYGARTMSADDKNTFDTWYIQNASLWLDIKIMLGTVMVFARGERVDHNKLHAARSGLELKNQNAAGSPVPNGLANNAEGDRSPCRVSFEYPAGISA